jgi:hypothetical protein
MSHAITRRYIRKKMEQILKEELEALNVNFLEKTTKEVLPSQMIIMGTSISIVKMERPLEDHEVNATYWYHSWCRDIALRVKNYDK